MTDGQQTIRHEKCWHWVTQGPFVANYLQVHTCNELVFFFENFSHFTLYIFYKELIAPLRPVQLCLLWWPS